MSSSAHTESSDAAHHGDVAREQGDRLGAVERDVGHLAGRAAEGERGDAHRLVDSMATIPGLRRKAAARSSASTVLSLRGGRWS